jgi:hypothetical protein
VSAEEEESLLRCDKAVETALEIGTRLFVYRFLVPSIDADAMRKQRTAGVVTSVAAPPATKGGIDFAECSSNVQLRYLSVGVRPPPVDGLNRSTENVLRFDHQPVAPAGVEPAYQIAHPGEKDHTKQTSQAVGSPKE